MHSSFTRRRTTDARGMRRFPEIMLPTFDPNVVERNARRRNVGRCLVFGIRFKQMTETMRRGFTDYRSFVVYEIEQRVPLRGNRVAVERYESLRTMCIVHVLEDGCVCVSVSRGLIFAGYIYTPKRQRVG